MKLKNLIFKPWIGKNYGNSELGRLLIIGDSHYFNNGLPNNLNDFTKAQIAELDIIASKFHNTILEVFGYQKHADFWKNIAFANSIQSAFTSSNQVPTNAEKDTAEKAFREYLEITKPEKVIVFSSRIWEHFFNNEGCWGKHLDKIDNRWNIRELDYAGGNCKALGIYHPNARNFASYNFSNIIKEFLLNY